nr:DUF2892 domain-containing protein [Sulfuricystis multivorans]
MGTGDRLLRAAIGLALLALLFWGPKTAWGALGLIPLFTAIMGSCIPYRIAGIDTRGEKERTDQGAAWMNLDFGERRTRMLAGFILITMAAVLPKVGAMHMWPVGGFAAERVLYDTRLDYKESDVTHYRFAAPASGTVKVGAQLVYYRHWYFMEPIKGEKYWSTDKWKYLLHALSIELADKDGSVAAADAGNHDGSLADMPPIPGTPGAGAWRAQAGNGEDISTLLSALLHRSPDAKPAAPRASAPASAPGAVQTTDEKGS